MLRLMCDVGFRTSHLRHTTMYIMLCSLIYMANTCQYKYNTHWAQYIYTGYQHMLSNKNMYKNYT